jgi:MFS family permease
MTEVLRSRDFRALWIGQSVSGLGDRMIVVALALFVTETTGKSSDVGLVLSAYVLPLVIFLPLGGVWADRVPRRELLIASDLVRCATQAGLALTIAVGSPSLIVIMAFEATCATAEAFSRPALTGLIPQTVPEGQVQQANSMVSLSGTAAEFLGPALATALVAGAKFAAVFAVDSATFLVGVVSLLAVRPRPRGLPQPRESFMRELRLGWRAVRERPWVWVTLVVFAAAAAIGFAPYFVLGPEIAGDRYDSTTVFGVLVTMIGVGAAAGALIGSRWRPRHPLRAAFLVIPVWPLSFLTFALGAPLALVIVAMVCTGLAMTLFEIWWDTTMIERIPPALLSRVSAWDWAGSFGLFPVSYLVVGMVAGSVPPSTLLAVGSVIAALLLALGLLPEETRALESAALESAE